MFQVISCRRNCAAFHTPKLILYKLVRYTRRTMVAGSIWRGSPGEVWKLERRGLCPHPDWYGAAIQELEDEGS